MKRSSWWLGAGSVVVTVLLVTLAFADARSDRLTELLRSSDSYLVRTQSALSLGRLRRAESVPVLIAALDDRHETVRAAATLSLGRIGDPAARPALERLAASPDQPSQVIAGARRALELISERVAVQ